MKQEKLSTIGVPLMPFLFMFYTFICGEWQKVEMALLLQKD